MGRRWEGGEREEVTVGKGSETGEGVRQERALGGGQQKTLQTYFCSAAMAANSCSLSACVVPKYCQPCVCMHMHIHSMCVLGM